MSHSLCGYEAPSDLQHVELGRRGAEPESLGRVDGVGASPAVEEAVTTSALGRATLPAGSGAVSTVSCWSVTRARLADAAGYWRAIATRSRSSGVIR